MTLTGSKKASWKALYQDAMLELDTGALPARIEAAQAAIHSRMAGLEGGAGRQRSGAAPGRTPQA
jgi:hypothetical protein